MQIGRYKMIPVIIPGEYIRVLIAPITCVRIVLHAKKLVDITKAETFSLVNKAKKLVIVTIVNAIILTFQ